MALKINEKFAPRANPPTTNYPDGSIKNESAPGAKDGTPLDADWGNDYVGFTDALLAETGISADGNPDTALASQRLDAIKSLHINDLSQSYDFDNVQEMINSTVSFPDGKKINLKSYFSGGASGGGRFEWDASGDKTEHDGGITIDPDVPFYSFNSTQAANEASVNTWYDGQSAPVGTGVWRRLNINWVLDSWYGVIHNSAYVYNEAFINRKAYETASRNAATHYIAFITNPNPTHVWGSIHPLRNDLKLYVPEGASQLGHYSDPSELAPSQAGHMWGFVQYADPYPGTDFTVTGETSKVNVVIDGEMGTVFNANNSQLHNNNVLGFFRTKDCSVVGEGGISQSDHNGVAFDGECLNPKVDLAYIRNYDDRAVTMKGTDGAVDSAIVNVRSLSGATRNGTVSESILVEDFDYAIINIGDAVLNATTLGTFVNSINCRLVDINAGYLENAIFWAAISNTGQLNINGGRYRNVTYIVRRGGVSPAAVPLKRIRIRGIECESTTANTIYLSQVAEGTFDELDVKDCDFSSVTDVFTPYGGKVNTSEPDLLNFKNNKTPLSWVYDNDIFNVQLDRSNTAVGAASFVYDTQGANGDSPYQKIVVIATHSGDSFRYQIEVDIRDLFLTNADYRQSIVADDGSILELTTVRSGTSFTFTITASAGTGTISSYSLSN